MCANHVQRFSYFFRRVKYLAWMAIFLCSIHTSFAQLPEVDSLENIINAAQGKEKVDAMNALAFKLILVDYNKALAFIIETKQLAEEIDYTKGISEALISEGVCHIMSG